jgi:RNA polymerase sigma-70 factor (ECF subfamily)
LRCAPRVHASSQQAADAPTLTDTCPVLIHLSSRSAAYIREPLPGAADEGDAAWEQLPDPAADALDEIWQREWEENLLSAAFRRLRSKVSSQQLLIFRLATPGDLPLTQVAKKLDVSLAQVYLARHRVGRLLKAEVQRLRRETE